MLSLRRLGVVACVAVMALAIVSPVWAAPIGDVRDEFDTPGYDGNNGSMSWVGPWQEAPLADGASSGEVRAVTKGCAATACLRFGPGNVTGHGVYREVDLSSAAAASLTFGARRELGDGGDGRIYVAVSVDGWLWTSLLEMPVDATDDKETVYQVDLSKWVGSAVRVGFFGSGVLGGHLYVDDVEVLLSPNRPLGFAFPLSVRDDREGEAVTIAPSVPLPAGDSFRFTATGLPVGVQVDPTSGTISGTIGYEAAAGSPYATVVTASDGQGAMSSESFTWAVTAVNRPPVVSPIADQKADELTPFSVAVVADDPDLPDDSLRFVLVTSPAGATISSAGVVEWTPSEAQGPDRHTFVVRVEDSADPPATDEVTFDVEVAEVNVPPELGPIPDMALRAGDLVSVAVVSSDADLPANSLEFSASGLPPGVAIDPATGRLSGSIAADAVPESGTAIVTAQDDGFPVATDIQTFSWQIGNGNRPPTIDPIAQAEIGDDGGIVFTVEAGDADGDDLAYWLAAGIDPVPDGATIDAATGEFRWYPTEDQHGATYRINVGVSDSGAPRLSATQLVTLVVPEYNHPPTVEPVSDQSTAEGQYVRLQIEAADPGDAGALSYEADGLPSGLAMAPATGLISGVVDYAAAGLSPYNVSIAVTDDGLPVRSASVEFAWVISDTNRPPEVAATTVVALVNEPRTFSLAVSDPDGDPLTYATTTSPTFGALTGEAPDLVYTAVGGRHDEFTYVVSDGEFEVEGTVTIEIRLSNDPPQANVDEYEGEDIVSVAAPGVLANDTDPDGEELSARLVAGPEHGEVVLNADGSFEYRPEPGYLGSDKFTYAAVDALDEESVASVALTIGVASAAAVPPEAPADDSSLIAVVAASQPNWQEPQWANQSLTSRLWDSAATLLVGLMTTVAGVRFPLVLLSAALALALAFGRVSLWPVSTRGEGTVRSFDAGAGLGRLVSDADGEEVVVPRAALGARMPYVGQRVEFLAATIRGRLVALRVWPAS